MKYVFLHLIRTPSNSAAYLKSDSAAYLKRVTCQHAELEYSEVVGTR